MAESSDETRAGDADPGSGWLSGELRAAKGAILFAPDGSERLLRVELEPKPGPEFRSRRARLRLRQKARTAVAARRLPSSLSPEHGIPEQAIGDAAPDPSTGLVILRCGELGLLVELPEAAPRSGRLACALEAPLRVDAIVWL
jgi:hypothetical protein